MSFRSLTWMQFVLGLCCIPAGLFDEFNPPVRWFDYGLAAFMYAMAVYNLRAVWRDREYL